MASRFVRQVRTASGAVAVQVVLKEQGRIVEVEHPRSAHTEAELALVLAAAHDRLHSVQEALDLGEVSQSAVSTDAVADWTRKWGFTGSIRRGGRSATGHADRGASSRRVRGRADRRRSGWADPYVNGSRIPRIAGVLILWAC